MGDHAACICVYPLTPSDQLIAVAAWGMGGNEWSVRDAGIDEAMEGPLWCRDWTPL